MRAHCINIYDNRSRHMGDIWLSAAYSDGTKLRLDMADMVTPVADLHESDVRKLKEACDAFLAEREAARRVAA